MHIIILSRSDNVHADAIEKYCSQYATVDRINFDFDKSGLEKLPMILFGQKSEKLLPNVVFVHHPRISVYEKWFADEMERKLFIASWDSVKEWMEAEFPNALWVNRPSASFKSRNVLGQLRLAESLGLSTPSTLFTNDIHELREFAGNDRVAIKQGNLGVHLDKKRILTSLVDITSIDSKVLCRCPCLFQKYIPKKYELRVHVIGEVVLTCRIDSQASAKTRIDWRDYDLENTPHIKHYLDPQISSICIKIVKQLGLGFGIIDMIVSPGGEHVFLECNAQGHWIWIEELTGLPITKTLCEYLLSNSR